MNYQRLKIVNWAELRRKRNVLEKICAFRSICPISDCTEIITEILR